MPAHVQDLLVEVDLVRIRLLSHPSTLSTGSRSGTACSGGSLLAIRPGAGRRVDGRWDSNLLGLEGRLVGLEHHLNLLFGVGGVDHEVVVVTAGHDILGIAGEDDLKLVEDAVVLVCVAESRAEMLMDGNGLDWLALHVDVPDLHGQVVTRQDVATVV